MQLPLPNRTAAGKALAQALAEYRGREDAIVLALPRGGVPVASQVASHLGLRLDVLVVRKLGLPSYRELAMGAIASGGVRVLNDEVVRAHRVSPEEIAAVAASEQAELDRRDRAYRGTRPFPALTGQVVILVDDGLATGATMEAAVLAVHKLGAAEVIVAVPVAPADTVQRLATVADRVICLATPEPFFAIGNWYLDFGQTSDQEVLDLLAQAWRSEAG